MKKGKKRTIRGFTVFLVLTLCAAIVFYFQFTTVKVSGPSMEPTLHSGQRVLVSKAYWLIGPIRDGDIVVLKDPGGPGDIIKRVYRMGGEDVDWKWRPEAVSLETKEYFVPHDEIYVLGDNRSVSEDSRKFGPVDLTKVVGKVIVKR